VIMLMVVARKAKRRNSHVRRDIVQ